MLEISDKGDGQTVDGADFLADGENVQQSLSGVLAGSISSIDHRLAAPSRGTLEIFKIIFKIYQTKFSSLPQRRLAEDGAAQLRLNSQPSPEPSLKKLCEQK